MTEPDPIADRDRATLTYVAGNLLGLAIATRPFEDIRRDLFDLSRRLATYLGIDVEQYHPARLASTADRWESPAGEWASPWWFIRGRDCYITLEKRPGYCDRGNYVAKIFARGKLARSLDEADMWPRYYFDQAVARSEVEAWLRKRGEWAADASEAMPVDFGIADDEPNVGTE